MNDTSTPAAFPRFARMTEVAHLMDESWVGRRVGGLFNLVRLVWSTTDLGSTDETAAFLFGSYAQKLAIPDSDSDLLIVEKTVPDDWAHETTALRDHMTLDKDIDLIVLNEHDFNYWKNQRGTVQYEAAQRGIRLV